MEKRLTLNYKHIARTEGLAKNKKLEAVPDFRKQNIHLAFADMDEQLKQLAFGGNISHVRRITTIHQIRNRLFELCNQCLYGLDVREFASHEPDDKTPLNSRC
jgi:hypothetical protein